MRTWAPLLALVLALIALVLLPVLRGRLVEPLNKELRLGIEPARSIVTRMHLTIDQLRSGLIVVTLTPSSLAMCRTDGARTQLGKS